MLYDIVWCFMMLYDAIWCFMMLYDAIWCYMMLYDIVWCFMMLYDAIWCYMILYDALWCYMMLYDALWCYMMLYDTIWCCMILYDSISLKNFYVIYIFVHSGHELITKKLAGEASGINPPVKYISKLQTSLVEIRLIATCHNLLKQLAANLWIPNFNNQLATSLLTT